MLSLPFSSRMSSLLCMKLEEKNTTFTHIFVSNKQARMMLWRCLRKHTVIHLKHCTYLCFLFALVIICRGIPTTPMRLLSVVARVFDKPGPFAPRKRSPIQPGAKVMHIQPEKENSRRNRTNKGKTVIYSKRKKYIYRYYNLL